MHARRRARAGVTAWQEWGRGGRETQVEAAWGVGAGLRMPGYTAEWLDRCEDDSGSTCCSPLGAAEVRTNRDESEGRGSLQSHA